MASKSQTQYMASVALVIGAMYVMGNHFRHVEKCARTTRAMLKTHLKAGSAITLAHGHLTPDEIKEIGQKIAVMQSNGLEGAESCRVYISMLIGVISEMLTDIPERSPKHRPLFEVQGDLERLYELFPGDPVEADRAGMELMFLYQELFGG